MSKAPWALLVLCALVGAGVPVQASAPAGSVSGVVVDTSGTPIPGVVVTFDRQKTATGGDGRYVFTGVTGGSHKMSASKSGFTTVVDAVEVKSATVKNFTLRREGLTLSGRVIDSSGAGWDGADVSIVHVGSGGQIQHATTNQNGSYRFEGLAPGQIRIEWALPPGNSGPRKVTTFDLAGNMTKDLVYNQGFTVHGIVRNAMTGAPIAGAQVSAGPNHVTVTRADGSYSLSRVMPSVGRDPTGWVRFDVTKPGFLPLRDAVDVRGDTNRDFGLTAQ